MTQSAAEWHAERKTGIGASDMSDLFSLPSPYSTIPEAGGCVRRLWYEKRGVTPDFERITKPSMQRGTDCEEIVARKLAAATGWRVTKRKAMLRHPELPFLIAHVDREAATGVAGFSTLWNRGRHAVECKTMNGHVAKQVQRRAREFQDRAPNERSGLQDGYLLQMQAILLAGNGRYAAGVFAVLDVDAWELLPPIFIEHDYAVQEKITSKAEALWSQIKHPSSDGPERLASFDPRCSECPWRRTCHS